MRQTRLEIIYNSIEGGLMENQLFQPTKAMKLYAYKRAQSGNRPSNRSLGKELGLAAETISRWKKINGFNEWLEEQISLYRSPLQDELLRIGRQNIDDFRFWNVLVEKYGLAGTNSNETKVFHLAYRPDDKPYKIKDRDGDEFDRPEAISM